ncbi:MAG: dihydroorotate dehydrogenase electron transfer subunit, partial [Atopobium sp.]|nr:dihydroorotate dehydrogenase electron transfer subunit [Atopobium sp.]
YTCGPEPMMRSVAKLAIAHNVACQVSMERMMSCAFGACNTCNVPLAKGGYASACMVGPVFEAKEIAW